MLLLWYLMQDLLTFSLKGLAGWAHLVTINITVTVIHPAAAVCPAAVCCLLQDLLIFSLKGLGGWAHLASQNGVEVPQEIQSFITGATFSTLTNGEQLLHLRAALWAAAMCWCSAVLLSVAHAAAPLCCPAVFAEQRFLTMLSKAQAYLRAALQAEAM
jgi:hypothetical protein